ncbi:MAG TPA: BMP family ABC transporter substrate-binding protein [Bacillota bacterium]|jgi:basic membrane protein A|nr:BMP family ABC transporter substrate-binding protein [Fastidiosipila sp.]HPX93075.1 BMP family ABC transporter substrate-binding protein [Bacillota bacterium]HQB80852.1 BMP family ABC transporter substrate-binding protein [Bacillota bacterium]
MKTLLKKLLLVLLVISLIAGVACAPKTEEPDKPPATEGEGPPATQAPETPDTSPPSDDEEGLKIAIVTTSGVDDGSFGQDCYNGILQFIDKNPSSTVKTVKEPDNAKVMQAVEDIFADYDVLVLPGFQFAPVGVLAMENEDIRVILVDSAPTDENGEEQELDNVYGMLFSEQESGFFAGVAAALETKTGKVGSVHGMAFPPVVNYQFGFEAGVKYANKHLGTSAEIISLPSYAGTDVTGANVGSNYVGDFADEATGKIIGNELYDLGCDILFVAAGASGNGVFTAAKERKDVFCIGCDVDQYDDGDRGDGTNIILTSALKVMHLNVDRQLQAILDGTFKGKNEVLTVQTDSTGYVSAPGRHQLSEDTLAKLKEVYDKVKAGDIVPPGNFTEQTVEDFPGL